MSKKALCALEAVIDIAYNGRPDPVQAKDITARQGVPQRYLEQVLQHLVRAGILRGVRGPRGGYRLARERRRVSVGQVVREIATMEIEDEEANQGSELGHNVVRPLIDQLQEEMLARLDDVSIEDMCRKARQSQLPTAGADTSNFEI